MDFLSNIRPDPEVLREPRGFMRIVQLVLAIFAFGTVTSVRTVSHVIVNCGPRNDTNEQDIPFNYGYPFRLADTATVKLPFCSRDQTSRQVFTQNFSASAEFFCFIGVMSFLVLILLIPAYVFLTSIFAKNSLAAKVDFIASCVWTVLWFIASTAWADNLSKLTDIMDPENMVKELGQMCDNPHPCRAGRAGDHSTLVVSVLFGFLNMGLSGASLWFLFKETDMHKDKADGHDDPSMYADPGYQTQEYAADPSEPNHDPVTPTGGMHSSFESQGDGANDYYGSGQPAY